MTIPVAQFIDQYLNHVVVSLVDSLVVSLCEVSALYDQ